VVRAAMAQFVRDDELDFLRACCGDERVEDDDPARAAEAGDVGV
jgi:hypothetical protein